MTQPNNMSQLTQPLQSIINYDINDINQLMTLELGLLSQEQEDLILLVSKAQDKLAEFEKAIKYNLLSDSKFKMHKSDMLTISRPTIISYNINDISAVDGKYLEYKYALEKEVDLEDQRKNGTLPDYIQVETVPNKKLLDVLSDDEVAGIEGLEKVVKNNITFKLKK
jgi:ribosome-binding ATPase YchF (GTP1/OBG family)